MGKKILGWALVGALALYLVNNPAGAAHTARAIGSGLARIGASLVSFLTSATG